MKYPRPFSPAVARGEALFPRLAFIALPLMIASLLVPGSRLAAQPQYSGQLIWGGGPFNVGGPPVFDANGNIYGIASNSGSSSVIELSPTAPGALAGWTSQVLYNLNSSSGGLVMDAKGNLYGAEPYGGINGPGCYYSGCGIVFELSPPAAGSSSWTGQDIYQFNGGTDGASPEGPLTLDAHGNLYGISYGDIGDTGIPGTAFELSPPSSGAGPWTKTILSTSFSGIAMQFPGGMIFDSAGNLYGTELDGLGDGDIFELSPPSGGSGFWTKSSVFPASCLTGGLVFDSAGNLYGTIAPGSCEGGHGIVFELSPPATAGGSWTESTLYSFCANGICTDGDQPRGELVFDGKGNLYGVTIGGGTPHDAGVVYELSPPGGGGTPWTETLLYVFCYASDCGTGHDPFGGLLFDSMGNLYGPNNAGEFEISPPQLVTTTTLSASPSSTRLQQPVTLSAVVTANSGATPTGTLTFYNPLPPVEGSGPPKNLGTFPLDSTGRVSLTYSGGHLNLDYFIAVYSGSSTLDRSVSNTVTQTVSQWPSTTVLTSSANPAHVGGTIAYTAKVEANGPTRPTGTITFTSSDNIIVYSCMVSVPLSAALTASCKVPDQPHGKIPVVASYSGDSTYLASSGNLLQVMEKGITHIDFPSLAGPVTVNNPTSFVAFLKPWYLGPSPTGKFSFKWNGAEVSDCSAVSMQGTQAAVCRLTPHALGLHTLEAIYPGDSNYMPSAGTLAVNVVKSASAVTLATSLNPALAGFAVTYTATVAAAANPYSSPAPSGSVAFTSNGIEIKGCISVALSKAGKATCTTKPPAPGTFAVKAVYSGSASYGPASASLSQKVIKP